MGPFEVLGVQADATDEEVRAAWRKAIARYHPDRNDGDELMFRVVQDAYAQIDTAEKRARLKAGAPSAASSAPSVNPFEAVRGARGVITQKLDELVQAADAIERLLKF